MDSASKRIKLIRKELGNVSQDNFAKSLGIANHKIKDIEINKTKISTEIAQKIEEIFHYNFRWVMLGEGSKFIDERIKESEPDFDKHGGWEPRDLHDFVGVKKGLGYAQAVSLLADIFRTEDLDLINSTISSLREAAESLPQSNIIPIDPGHRMAEMFMNKSGIQLDEEGKEKLSTFFKKRLEKKIAELEGQIIEETEDELIDLLKVAKGDRHEKTARGGRRQ